MMYAILICWLTITWVIGALLTLKYDAAYKERPTAYNQVVDLLVVLLLWIIIAPSMLMERHKCCGPKGSYWSY